MRSFPDLEIPDFYRLSKTASWDPKKYQPMVYDEKIKKMSEQLRPGTLSYDDFWDEMDYYCYNGFQPKGMPRITGRHFYYLNFNQIELLKPGWKKKRLSNPFYRDLDHMLFLELEGAIENKYGLIIGKPRRVGLSEFGSLNMNFEHTFFQYNKLGVCAGKDDKVSEFREKLESSLRNVHTAYKNGSGILVKNADEMKLGYEDMINRQKEQLGIQSLSRYKTMYADSSAFEGGSYSTVIFEEIGLFQNLLASYAATKPCFMEGNIQFGLPLLYGTGGEIDKGAYGFKEMWNNHWIYNLKKIFIPAYYYYPGDGLPDPKTGKVISFFNYQKGVTDRDAARNFIEEERKIAQKSKETYIKHIQSFPLHEKEMFTKTQGGILDIIRLNYQLKRINNGEELSPILQGDLEWVDSEETIKILARAKNTKEKTKIRVENKSKVIFKENSETGVIYKDSAPLNPNAKHLSYKPDIGACDSYDEEIDTTKTNISSGCVMAYRLYSGPGREYNKPVGLLVQRGDGSYDDDEFYENAAKMAIYWDMEILFEYTKFQIIRYFYDVGLKEHVRGRPELEVTSSHQNSVGVKMPETVKNVITKELKREVKENIHKCFFHDIILDLIDYGDRNTDIAMTYGMIKLHEMDLFGEVSEGIEMSSGNPGHFQQQESYYVDIDGNLRVNTFGEKDYVDTFIPERDLDEKQYNEYIETKQAKEKEHKKALDDYQADAKKRNLDVTLTQIIEDERNRLAERLRSQNEKPGTDS